MADTPDLGSGAFGREGSSPFSRILQRLGVLRMHEAEVPFGELLREEKSTLGVSFSSRGNSSVVERHLAKVDVAGPTPVSRFPAKGSS